MLFRSGAASIACIELIKAMGLPHENAILVDTKGVIWQGRTEGMNQWKSAHAVRTKARTLKDAMEGADVFFGLSVKGAVTKAVLGFVTFEATMRVARATVDGIKASVEAYTSGNREAQERIAGTTRAFHDFKSAIGEAIVGGDTQIGRAHV